jgi:hypothetical protein
MVSWIGIFGELLAQKIPINRSTAYSRMPEEIDPVIR